MRRFSTHSADASNIILGMNHLRTSLLGWTLAAALVAAPIGANEDLQIPDLGDASSGIISPEMERRIGEDFLKQIHAGLPTVSDPILNYYVDVHMSQLATHSQLRERVLSTVLIDSEEINAFAAPGGVVGINAGLLLHAQDVHEYSSVIAHELAHLSQRHFARGIEESRAQALPTLAALVAAIAIGALGGGDAGLAALSTAQAASQARQLRYSRTREQEADRIGMSTLVRSGLDPDGMGRMFERMGQAYRFTRRPPEFLLTHPLSESRVSDARQQAREFSYDADRRGRQLGDLDYGLMRSRVQVKYAADANAVVKQFEKALADNPGDLAAEYGLALALSKAGDHDRALAVTESLHGSDRQNILYIATHAEALVAAEKFGEAAKLLSHQLVINPDNTPLTLLYADALVGEKRFSEAQAVLERQSLVRRQDVNVWYNLAETAGLAGDVIAVHRARAEYFVLHGGYSRAIQHLEYAQRLVSRADHRLRAQIDQRIRDLRTALMEATS